MDVDTCLLKLMAFSLDVLNLLVFGGTSRENKILLYKRALLN